MGIEQQTSEDIQNIISYMLITMPFIMPIIKMDIDFVYDKNFQTDGRKIYYNPNFWATLNQKEKAGMILYEWLHVAFLHPYRGTGKNQKIWELACGFECGCSIVDNHSDLSLPKGYLYDSKYSNMCAEQIYIDLQKGKDPNNGFGYGRGKNPSYADKEDVLNMLDKNSDKLDKMMDLIHQNGDAPDDLKEELVFAVEQSKKIGKTPLYLERRINALTQSKADWKTILSKFFKDLVNHGVDRSFAFPKKWGWQYNMVIPSDCGYKKPKIVVIYDTSGSILNEHIQKFNGELKKMLKHCSECTVITADTEVHEIEKIRNIDDIVKHNKIKFKGGGGTSFIDALQKAERLKPDLVIYLTDGVGDYGKPPRIKNLLWALTEQSVIPPYGKHLLLE
jgi:predicted metal-dependent peptidase